MMQGKITKFGVQVDTEVRIIHSAYTRTSQEVKTIFYDVRIDYPDGSFEEMLQNEVAYQQNSDDMVMQCYNDIKTKLNMTNIVSA